MTILLIVVLMFLGLGLQQVQQQQLAYSQLTEEEAELKLDEIVMNIQTSEGLDELDKCGYTNATEAIKVLDCYEKNKDRIK